MNHVDIILLLSLAIIAYGVVSSRLTRSPITAPMAFTLLGFLIGTGGLNLARLSIDSEVIMGLAELTLVLILFSDASRINIKQLRGEHQLPLRLLGIGLPLTIILGLCVGLLIFPKLGFWNVAVLAAILAPTDAALGQAVVTLKRLPVSIRQALNVESGLNDGIAVPAIMLFLWSAGAHIEGEGTGYWIGFVGMQLMLGPTVGIGTAWIGGWLLDSCRNRGWMSDEFQRLALIGLALTAWSLAEVVGGNGFIAAFSAGLTLGARHQLLVEKLHRFAEAEGQILSLLVFIIFGGAMVPEAFSHVNFTNLSIVGYALLSLTLIRMIPVSISLLGRGLRPATHLFMGWFGPRGIATIIFALLVLEESGLPEAETISGIAVLVVLLSILLHGVTAWPLSSLYARIIDKDTSSEAERMIAPEMPTRFGNSTD
ncbi:MAG: cation:proton antiporter [Candidatus Kapaibacterium sp.]